MNLEVSSVSKREQRLLETASAVSVITQEDIRRSGATNLPDLLRLVPGLNVAQIDASKWAITARGFNGRWANKLLVLVDGRDVYSPVFSGVLWDAQNPALEDIERIEIIRGPGATVWGANAVNGVINIISKRVEESQGVLVSGGGGSENRGFGAARWGGRIARQASLRVYARSFDRDASLALAGLRSADDWNMNQAGFRLDWDPHARTNFSFQGNGYGGSTGDTEVLPILVPPYARIANIRGTPSGGDFIGQWRHVVSDRSELTGRITFTHESRDNSQLREQADQIATEIQHDIRLGDHHHTVWGVGVRVDHQQFDSHLGSVVAIDPSRAKQAMWNGFVQDEVVMSGGRLRLTAGSKFELTRDEHDHEVVIQPSARLLWAPTPSQAIWTAASRAVRSPSQANEGLRFDVAAFPDSAGNPMVVRLFGNPDFQAEDLRAYELGYRCMPHVRLSLDLSTFYNVYDRLETSEPGAPFYEPSPSPAHVVLPLHFGNLMEGNSRGAELFATWSATRSWRVAAGFSSIDVNLRLKPGGLDATAAGKAAGPTRQLSLQSFFSPVPAWDLDVSLSAVDRWTVQLVPAYARLDVRVGWRPAPGLELSAVGQNLLEPRHLESNDAGSGVLTTWVERGGYVKATWRR